MGKTAFSGPVWGAKSLLYAVKAESVSSGGGNGVSTNIGAVIVPVGEDWYLTEFNVYRSSTGSTVYGVSLDDDSTVVSSVTFTSSLAEQHQSVALTATAGEYAGYLVASGSTLRIRHANSSVVGASSALCVSVYGYPRFIASTRYAEVQ